MIDAHAHGIPEDKDVADARALGIESAAVIGWGPAIMPIARHYKGFIRPIVQAELGKWRAADVRAWACAGACGIKFTMPREPYSSPRYWPLYDACVEEGLPAVFHSGYLGFYGSESLCVHMEHTRPAEIDWIARNWPELVITLAHFGNPWWDEAAKVVAANRNVYVDLSGGSAYRRDMDSWVKLLCPNGQPWKEVLTKVMFGTDKTLGNDYISRAPEYLRFYEALCAHVAADQATKDLIMGGNAERVFPWRW